MDLTHSSNKGPWAMHVSFYLEHSPGAMIFIPIEDKELHIIPTLKVKHRPIVFFSQNLHENKRNWLPFRSTKIWTHQFHFFISAMFAGSARWCVVYVTQMVHPLIISSLPRPPSLLLEMVKHTILVASTAKTERNLSKLSCMCMCVDQNKPPFPPRKWYIH